MQSLRVIVSGQCRKSIARPDLTDRRRRGALLAVLRVRQESGSCLPQGVVRRRGCCLLSPELADSPAPGALARRALLLKLRGKLRALETAVRRVPTTPASLLVVLGDLRATTAFTATLAASTLAASAALALALALGPFPLATTARKAERALITGALAASGPAASPLPRPLADAGP